MRCWILWLRGRLLIGEVRFFSGEDGCLAGLLIPGRTTLMERRQLCIYVDVDDTIVRSAGSKRIPIPAVIKHIAELHREGALLYCWSSGGGEYAKQSAEEFGIDHCFAAFPPKPHVIIDDQRVVEWPQFLHVHPSSTRTLEVYRETLRGNFPG